MEAIDRNKLDTAISYVERIADGKNPVTGAEVGEDTELNKNVTEPTEKGRRIGISSEKRRGMAGAEYIRVIYGKDAQEFIVQNMERILNGEAAE